MCEYLHFFSRHKLGFTCTLTCQVLKPDEIPVKLKEILNLITQLPITVKVDFFFFVHSLTR